MAFGREKILDCTAFEESLSDYLERTLEPAAHKAMASHALQCPLCHGLLNDVKDAMAACQQLAEPRPSVSRLEARILASTVPDATINCREFEEYLTDYLDGFLPASVFHRWERHAVLCDECSDLPGMVVRSLASIVNYKLDELAVPVGLHERILAATLGTEHAKEMKPSRMSQLVEWVRGFRLPIAVPQLAPVALMTIIAFLTFSQTVSADGTLSDVYAKSYQLAQQTYQQGAQVLNEATGKESSTVNQEPVSGTTEVESR
jgi:predicted anti-sigma-YlaC factor YlaD